MSTLWGIQDCALNAFQFTICSFQFKKLSVAFAIYYWFKSVMGFTVIVLESLLAEKESFVWYFIAIGAFGVFAWVIFLLGFPLDASLETKEKEVVSEGGYERVHHGDEKTVKSAEHCEDDLHKPMLTNKMN